MKKKILLVALAAVLVLGMFLISCGNRQESIKIEYYNPIGYDYNTIIEYFEKNNLVYMRSVSDLDNSFLHSFDNSDTTQRCYYFNDDNICYGFQWVYMSSNTKFDNVAKYLNKDFKKIPYTSTSYTKIPYDSIAWQDIEQNLTYIITKDDKTGWFSLWCHSEKYQQFNEQDDRMIIDFSNCYGFDPEEDEWHKIYSGAWSSYDSIASKMIELTFSTDRFVIPRDLEGKIEHFRNQGKILTYEIVQPLYIEDDVMYLIVKDEDDTKFWFAFHVNSLKVTLIYADGKATLFSND
jgi:hypothetical protein